MRLQEIEERLSAISVELDNENIDVSALKTEADSLLEERKAILAEAEDRKELRNAVSNLKTEPVKTFVPEEERNMEVTYESVVDMPEYRSAWAKALQNKPLSEVEKRAYATTDTHNAVPTIIATKFFEKMKKLAPMLSEITLMRVAGNLKFMTEGTRVAAAKHTQNTAADRAADAVVSVTLGGYEFLKVIGISRTASNMSIAGFEDWLVEMLSGDIARAIDNYIINDSTNGIVAITYTTSTNQILQAATTGYGYADLINLVALLPAAYDAEAKFLVNKSVLYTKVKNIVDTANRPIFDAVEKTLLGYPVVVDDYVGTSKNEIYLGRWTDIVGNLSQDITVDRSVESGFLNNSVDYRGVAVFDSKPAKIDGIVRLVSTTS